MTKVELRKFKKLLEKERSSLMFSGKVIREDFYINRDDRLDEADQASLDTDQSMRMRLTNRETLYLRKIDESLKRVDEGTFGECMSCGCEIETKRLLARPTVTLCVSCKEDQEGRERLSVYGKAHKSVGHTLSRRLS